MVKENQPQLSWQKRLGIFLTVLWLIVVVAISFSISSNRSFDWSAFLLIGVLPVVLLYGCLWVIAGVRKDRREKRKSITAANLDDPHPWRRLGARMIDYGLFAWSASIAIVVFYPSAFSGLLGNNPQAQAVIASFLWTLVWCFIEPVFLMLWGATPGKMLLGIRVSKDGTDKINYARGLVRSFSVWFRGAGMGLPFVNLFTMYFAYSKLLSSGKAAWDSEYGFSVSNKPIGILRAALAWVVVFGILIANAWDRSETERTWLEQHTSIDWINPVTRETVKLPNGWRQDYSYQRTADDTTVAAFVNISADTRVHLMQETLSEPYTIKAYVDALLHVKQRALASIGSLGRPQVVEENDELGSALIEGYAKEGQTMLKIKFYVWTRDNKEFWHTFTQFVDGNEDAKNTSRKMVAALELSTKQSR